MTFFIAILGRNDFAFKFRERKIAVIGCNFNRTHFLRYKSG